MLGFKWILTYFLGMESLDSQVEKRLEEWVKEIVKWPEPPPADSPALRNYRHAVLNAYTTIRGQKAIETTQETIRIQGLLFGIGLITITAFLTILTFLT